MTAYTHGESTATTSQEGGKRLQPRPSVKKRTRDEAGQGLVGDDGAKAKKKVKTQPKSGGDKKQANHNFIVMKWNPQEFYSLLESADFMRGLGFRITNEKERGDIDSFKEIMRETMKNRCLQSEEVMQGRLHDLFFSLSQVLSLAVQDDSVFFGNKAGSEAGYLPSSGLGPDNQVDMILSYKRQNNRIPGIIPWENKVSWNFPGGSLTSKVQDYARLGRDVKIYELLPGTQVDSLADRSKTEPSDIANPEEGEDADIVDGMPGVAAAAAQRAGTERTKANDGLYEMKHNVFPVRQIVSYMLSFKTRYGILCTGYRIDFLMLKVVNKGTPEEELQVHIAGPLWTVGGLNTRVLNAIESSETEYYENIHRYGSDDTVSILDSNWSTMIGQYPFLEGLVRFFFATTKLESREEQGDQRSDGEGQTSASTAASTAELPQSTQNELPRSHMLDFEMPSWLSDYAKSRQSRQSQKKRNESYEELCKSSKPFYFENEQVKKEYFSMMKTEYDCDWSPSATLPIDDDDVESWKGGLSKFGPLTLAELEGGEREKIGFGRIGEAFKTKLQDLHVAYKLLRRSEWEDEDFHQRVEELLHEMKIYKILQQHQGTIIPRFLYAGSIVDALYWVIPECGEMIAFTTTYEGESLSSYFESGRVGTLGLKGTVRDQAINDLKKLHQSGVAHCDLELRNLVYVPGKKYDQVQEKSMIKFVDFGNARHKDDYEDFDSSDLSFDEDCSKDLKQLELELSKLSFEQENEQPLESAPAKSISEGKLELSKLSFEQENEQSPESAPAKSISEGN